MRAMRSRVPRSVVLVSLAVGVVAAAGCGGGSKSPTTSTTTPAVANTAAAGTTAATTTPTTAGTSAGATTSASGAASAALGALASAGNCKSLASLGAAASQAMSGSGTVDVAKEAQLLQQEAQKVPASIKPDFETYAQDLAKIASALGTYKPGTTPSAADLAKLSQLASQINMTKLSAAAAHISAWAKANCHA
jgi:hypothetical protein